MIAAMEDLDLATPLPRRPVLEVTLTEVLKSVHDSEMKATE